MVDPAAVAALITLGRIGEAEVPPTFHDPDQSWKRLMCGHEPWRAVASHLVEADLAALLRGLVLYSATGRSLGGSVSPVIPTFWVYAERFPDSEPALTRWIVAHRTNEYDPFGSVNDGGAQSVADFRRYQEWRRQDADRRAEEESQRQRTARAEKHARDATAATRNLPNAVRRGDAATWRQLRFCSTKAQTGTRL